MTTDILQAVFKCNLNKLKRLLPDRIRVNQEIPGTEGCTPLHLVVGIENIPESHDELTPVHIAAMWNNCFELEKLLQNGGNPWLTDNENKNSFDLAINNYAYDTYQLLHRYLAEDKLNFRSSSSKSSTKSLDCKEHVSYHETFHDDFANSTFYSANENFPVFFSSTDDESGNFLQNVSRILKKHLLKNENLDQEFSQMNLTKNINYDIPKDEKQPIFFNNTEANLFVFKFK
ncbi:ankyrin repeat and LEM domain-containing protein 1 [Caerostris extrusa]|uniref:Ankyrin repeat and LEM domain-containing protein 1 n=1 Tax=Caerostris extrusa TaxID=172846 RepID=A0AAV4XGQ7_CAEEX|nr:ankyrin repeat and LEM domain-containing protein 1 [Caerostris extrusa]